MGLRYGLWVTFLTLGCHRTFTTSVIQANPLAQADARRSEKAEIVIGDMDLETPAETEGPGPRPQFLERYPLHNVAHWTMISRDRLRFHVQLEHKWQEYADLRGWRAYLVDDHGKRYVPEVVESTKPRHVNNVWDVEQRSAIRNEFGDVVAVNEDGWKRRQTLATISVFRGKGDVVFYHPDIMRKDIRQLTLVIERSGQSFEFTWRFTEADS